MIIAWDDAPDIVAIIPTMGRDSARLARCLTTLRNQRAACRLAVVCVVNSAQAALDAAADFPEVRFVSAGLNLGWAGGLIFGHSLAEAPLYWFVQDDNEFDPDCLGHLIDRLDADPQLGLVSPVGFGADGRCPASSLGGVLAPDGTMAYWLPEEPTADVAESLASHDLSYVASRGSLVRASAWVAVGGLDANYYPVLWTDVDFCHALSQQGIGFAVEPTARIAAHRSASFSRPYGVFLNARNSAYFRGKWFGEAESTVPSSLERVAVPENLLRTVAGAASSTLLELAGAYSTAREAEADAVARASLLLKLVDEAREREAHMQDTLSWRITRPLRWLRRGITRAD